MRMFFKKENKTESLRSRIIYGDLTGLNYIDIILRLLSLITEEEKIFLNKVTKSNNKTELGYFFLSLILKYIFLPYSNFDEVEITVEAEMILDKILRANLYDPEMFRNFGFSQN